MNIGIVTVYDGVSNIGSYLQAYAMQLALKKLGHQVFFVEKKSVSKQIWDHVRKLNPKRAFLLRLHTGFNYFVASREFKFIGMEDIPEKLDALLFGSDEIWNMENPYFKDRLFFGKGIGIPKIAYAPSIGAMSKETFEDNEDIVEGLHSFLKILPRDDSTRVLIGDYLNRDLTKVCDPTLLVGREVLQKKIFRPAEKYILVYSYGLDQPMIDHICRFAKEKGLKIISAHFWHLFCDRTIACKPLEFGELFNQADYVFTSTFHGAIFAMMNHTKCCILPVREKVRAIAEEFGQSERIIEACDNYQTFLRIIEKPFDTEKFECILEKYRNHSQEALEAALKCLER